MGTVTTTIRDGFGDEIRDIQERVDAVRSQLRLIAAGLTRPDGELDVQRLSERWG